MSWKPIIGKHLTADEFKAYVANLQFPTWKPSGIALHNTANPSLMPLKGHGSWNGSSISPAQRIQNLAQYYKGLGWPSGPHLFIDDQGIWLFTPLNTPGTHSPSWNGTKIGIEMVGDYDIEEFDSGPGKAVRDNAVAALAILHAKLGLDPHTMKLHKEDPRTTHDCPGKKVHKDDVIRRVIEYMGSGGDHSTHGDKSAPAPAAPPPEATAERSGVVQINGLNLRSAAGASSDSRGTLPAETVVTILGEAMNGDTKWYHVKTPSGILGWLAAKYVTVGGFKKPKVTRQFIVDELKKLGWSEVVGYGVASNAYQESSFDPDAEGDHRTAYGLFQWHTGRQQSFKGVIGKDIRDATAVDQIKFLDWELNNTEKAAGAALRTAKTAYEAGAVFSSKYERPKAVSKEAFNRGTRAQQWYDEDHK